VRRSFVPRLTGRPFDEKHSNIGTVRTLRCAVDRSGEIRGRATTACRHDPGTLASRPGSSSVPHQDLATNTRQPEGAMWKAMREARGREIDAPSEWQRTSAPPSGATRVTHPSSEPSAERISAALQTSGGKGRPGGARTLGFCALHCIG
jgi:hypothetical protein